MQMLRRSQHREALHRLDLDLARASDAGGRSNRKEARLGKSAARGFEQSGVGREPVRRKARKEVAVDGLGADDDVEHLDARATSRARQPDVDHRSRPLLDDLLGGGNRGLNRPDATGEQAPLLARARKLLTDCSNKKDHIGKLPAGTAIGTQRLIYWLILKRRSPTSAPGSEANYVSVLGVRAPLPTHRPPPSHGAGNGREERRPRMCSFCAQSDRAEDRDSRIEARRIDRPSALGHAEVHTEIARDALRLSALFQLVRRVRRPEDLLQLGAGSDRRDGSCCILRSPCGRFRRLLARLGFHIDQDERPSVTAPSH